ncbi:zinc finger CCHC domain-containing protein 12-like [Thunnus thynnus]|uniref:zinc finger CCHC domain-containing protein 12-like n=1 Tax=Thunnus thynnus TaxID=8237 RepID=UPI0035282734
MEVVRSENVKVRNAVLVSGLSDTEVDKEVLGFLERYGSIARVVQVPSADTESKIIVEFQHEATVRELEKRFLPLHRATTDPKVIHHIQSLASVFSTEGSASATVAYLTELRELAKLSTRSFEDILRAELARIGESVGTGAETSTTEAPAEPDPTSLPDDPHIMTPVSPAIGNASSGNTTPRPAEDTTETVLPTEGKIQSPQLPADLVSTPEVQRVIVEHIVKSSEVGSQSNLSYKLKPFSGRVPHPAFEVDYDAWRSSVEFCLNDPTISDTQLVRKIVESLSPPAANIVKSLGPTATPKSYLTLLDSAYATVEDGDELFARFLNTNQNVGEKASDYLQRLYSALNSVISRKGVAPSDADKQLLRQFCRGCWDGPLITNLQLEQRRNEPPSFAELLLLLRTEEDKQANKAIRMKQHLGITKTKALSQLHTTCMPDTISSYPTMDPDDAPSADGDLKKLIANLSAQIAQLQARCTDKPVKSASKGNKKQQHKTKREPEMKEIKQITARVPRPKPWYCFRCGEDAHIASSCSNEPNPALVSAKREALKEKQRMWEIHNNPTDSSDLN